MNTIDRYVIKNTSLSGHHCCFSSSIVDTANADNAQPVCECWDEDMAKLIVSALNLHLQHKEEEHFTYD